MTTNKRVLLELLSELAPNLVKCQIDYAVFCDVAKIAYVTAIANSAKLRNGRTNFALVSAATSINRREIAEILHNMSSSRNAGYASSLAERVFKTWTKDKAFCDSKGNPRSLKLVSGRTSFAAIAKKTAGDIPPSAVLSYLMSAGIAKKRGNRVLLAPTAYKQRLSSASSNPLIKTIQKVAKSRKWNSGNACVVRSQARRVTISAGDFAEALYILREIDDNVNRTIEAFKDSAIRVGRESRNSEKYQVDLTSISSLYRNQPEEHQFRRRNRKTDTNCREPFK